jgi:hypothetical protein
MLEARKKVGRASDHWFFSIGRNQVRMISYVLEVVWSPVFQLSKKEGQGVAS